MAFYPPSTVRLEAAVSALLDRGDCDVAERVFRCQLVYRPIDPTYTVWAQSAIRASVAAAFARVLQRPFTVADDHWVLNLGEVEALLAEASC